MPDGKGAHAGTPPPTRRRGSAAYAPVPSRARRLLRAVGYGLAFSVPIALLAFLVREKFLPVIDLDEGAIRAATDITRAHDGLRTALVVWQEAFQPRWVYIVGSLVCLWVWRRAGLTTRAAWAFVTMMVAWNLQLVLKAVVQRARPVVSDPVSHAPGYSFPSGHVANVAAATTILVILLWPLLPTGGRRLAVAAAVVLTALTCLDRVFLGVHFPSDTVAGVLFGVGLGLASYAGYVGWNPVGPDDAPPPEEAPAPPPRPRGTP
ncbi:MAG TPA: phosphatase PAP2 family protein [Intrasporangium sp.]|uniref:phosphatase PAP2 family protein n=1 Tax=Intrasporangium sp. TaxID=1925024 RepID=UPI002D78C364|nr:phosphatase PAP2 family protein [Intrasporangium sp.]HET7398344.1 phosphatase PAP2 family protein [Intrasporangium sp.]